MWPTKKRLAVIVSVFLLFGLVCRASAAELIPEEDIRGDKANYRTQEAVYGHYEDTREISGIEIMSNLTELVYIDDPAYYVAQLVKTGEIVEEGQPVFEIRTEVDPSEIRELEVRLQRLKEDFENGKADREDAIAEDRETLEETEEGRAAEKLRLNIRKASVQLERFIYEQEREIAAIEKSLEKLYQKQETSYVYAPSSGEVQELKYYSDGDRLMPGDSLLKIKGDANPIIRMQEMTSIQSAYLRYGQEVTIQAERLRIGTLKGRVVFSPDAAPIGKNVYTLIEVDTTDIPEDELIRVLTIASNLRQSLNAVGVTGTKISQEKALIIPRSALQGGVNDFYVSVLGEDNAIHIRHIGLVHMTQKECWVLEGIQEHDKVILE